MSSSNRDYAPIVLFTFKRLDTLRLTVTQLLQNRLAKESDLIVFSDQAWRETDKARVSAVRRYLRTISGFRSVRIVEAKYNLGLANSIIEGVSEVLDEYGRAIVLEDDLLTTPNFLAFMNQALDEYAACPMVFSISGYAFDLGFRQGQFFSADGYFLNRGWSWGWATWRDRWTGIDWKMKDCRSFSGNGPEGRRLSAGGYGQNLIPRRRMQEKPDSWAVHWFYHQLKTRGLTLYPIFSKVFNAGFDEKATHARGSNRRYRPVLESMGKTQFRLPTEIRIKAAHQRKFRNKLGVLARISAGIELVIERIMAARMLFLRAVPADRRRAREARGG